MPDNYGNLLTMSFYMKNHETRFADGNALKADAGRCIFPSMEKRNPNPERMTDHG